MADNITLNAGSGGDTLAADDVAGVKYQIVKLAAGALDSAGLLIAEAQNSGLPIQGEVAHDAAGGDNPILVGGRASAAAPSDVSADNDAVKAWYLRNGAAAAVLTAAGELIGGNAANGLDVDVTRVSGTVTVDGSGVTQPVSHAGLADLAAAIVAEDVASAGADVGMVVMARRTDTPANQSGTDGDYEFLQVSAGRLWASATIDAALPAGTNAIGKLAANSGVDIGDVDVLSVIPGVGATNLGKAEDAAHADGDTGVMMLAVRDDTLNVRSGAENDYEPLHTNANGALWAEDVNSSAIAASLSVLDDWDESDRAKVNIIVGQAGVAAGAGAVGATTQRVTHASDDPVTTALQLIDDTVFAEDTQAQAADKGIGILAVRRDADTTLVGTDGDYANLQVDANGYLKVEIFDGGGSHTVDNNGTFAVQVDGNALTALQLIDDPVVQDDAGFTPGTTKVMMAGFEADESSTDSVDEGDGGAARMTLDRKQIVTPQPHTAGGCAIFRSLDLDETEEDVKTSAGQVYGIIAMNLTNALRYLKLYNATAANTTVGSTTPVVTIPIPANNDTDGAGFVLPIPMGIAFDTAICAAVTTGLADADTGAPGANDVVVQIFYK